MDATDTHVSLPPPFCVCVCVCVPVVVTTGMAMGTTAVRITKHSLTVWATKSCPHTRTHRWLRILSLSLSSSPCVCVCARILRTPRFSRSLRAILTINMMTQKKRPMRAIVLATLPKVFFRWPSSYSQTHIDMQKDVHRQSTREPPTRTCTLPRRASVLPKKEFSPVLVTIMSSSPDCTTAPANTYKYTHRPIFVCATPLSLSLSACVCVCVCSYFVAHSLGDGERLSSESGLIDLHRLT